MHCGKNQSGLTHKIDFTLPNLLKSVFHELLKLKLQFSVIQESGLLLHKSCYALRGICSSGFQLVMLK